MAFISISGYCPVEWLLQNSHNDSELVSFCSQELESVLLTSHTCIQEDDSCIGCSVLKPAESWKVFTLCKVFGGCRY